jgi:hypothetical protein
MFLADDIPDLKIQRTAGKLISLTQTDGDDGSRIDIHPIQVRYIAEQFGLVPSSDVEAAKAITALQRRLCVMRDRARAQVDALKATGSPEHLAYAEATAAIANEYCADIEHAGENREPSVCKQSACGSVRGSGDGQ